MPPTTRRQFIQSIPHSELANIPFRNPYAQGPRLRANTHSGKYLYSGLKGLSALAGGYAGYNRMPSAKQSANYVMKNYPKQSWGIINTVSRAAHRYQGITPYKAKYVKNKSNYTRPFNPNYKRSYSAPASSGYRQYPNKRTYNNSYRPTYRKKYYKKKYYN